MKIKFLTLLAVFASLLSGCYPGGAEYVDELDTAIGMYSTKYDFKSPKDYYLNPTIKYVKDGESTIKLGNEANEAKLLAELEDQLDALGYKAVDPIMVDGKYDHDFDVLITVYESNYTGTYWYYDWYSYYYGYYPGGGYGYPVTYSYSTGTCNISFVNPNLAIPEVANEYLDGQSYYSGAVNGLLEGSDLNIQSRLKAGLGKLFNQAPFKK